MKTILFLAALVLAGTASAESSSDIKVNRIEVAVTAPDGDETTAEGSSNRRGDPPNLNSSRSNTSSRAQDYNSSRSNTTSLRQQGDGVDATGKPGTRAQDYNSSRSNNSGRLDTDDDGDSVDTAVCRNGVDNDCDSPTDDGASAKQRMTSSDRTARVSDFGMSRSSGSASAPQRGSGADYNSSRSNKTHAPAAGGDDACGNGVDEDCDGRAEAAPANHNTTRSNRTSP